VKVIQQRPPMFLEIAAAFPDAYSKGVIFAWGDVIYNPSGTHIQRELFAHEAVHGERQKAMGIRSGGSATSRIPPSAWPRRSRRTGPSTGRTASFSATAARAHRALHRMAVRLASDLYGQIITYMEAKRVIVEGIT
jgi:hypothetical protein